MQEAGVDPGLVEMREIETEAQAREEHFVGSPTILIDGRDAQPAGETTCGLTCRVYHLRDGRFSPTPDPADVREAILQRMTEGR